MTDDSNWVAAVLEDEEEAELVGADGDLWDEHGVDSDGAWHESDLGAGKHFVLNKPGSYFVRMYAEAEPGRTPSVGSVASFTVKENTLPPLYLGLYGFLILILGIGFLLAGSPDARARISQAMESSSDD
ncbi:MAG: hypothetical protein FJX77_03870 [Armatimonadetes bacterium]|nr:hypothetical protein [Armatimonadota bacterium]